MFDTNRFEEFISQYPIYEYRLLDTKEIEVRERVRTICREECVNVMEAPGPVHLQLELCRNVRNAFTVMKRQSFFPAWQRFLTL